MVNLAHRAICVKDLAASELFYREALGFELVEDVGRLDHPELAKSWELPKVSASAKLLRRPSDGPMIELVQFHAPLAEGPRQKRSTLQYGLVHISFYVEDIDAWADRIRAHGGTVYEETRAYFEGNDTTLIYCTDPDGTRVELMKSPGEAERFSHGGICVENSDAAIPFYEALEFQQAENYVLDAGFDWLGVINEVPGIKLRAQMMRNADGDTIELLQVYEPECFGSREKQPINRFGLTHLEFSVDDLEAITAKLVAAGGQHVAAADAVLGDMTVRQIIDRDGVRITLRQKRPT